MITNPLYYFENITNPTEFEINTRYDYSDTVFLVRDRVEKGWTLDFIFNMSGVTLASGNTFYYWGITGETNPEFYVDNNVSFGFTPDNKIRWRKSVYSDYCGDDLTVVENWGKTSTLCTGGTSNDFNITIVFERDYEYYGCCELQNEGGINDMFTGWTIDYNFTGLYDEYNGLHNDSEQIKQNQIINEENEVKSTILTLTEKWYKERYKRLGTLKIYHNGRQIYKNNKWEEVIPSVRETGNTISQILGGGTTGSGDIHSGVTPFVIKKVSYYETPLTYIDIRNNYLEHRNNYNITECKSGCEEAPIS